MEITAGPKKETEVKTKEYIIRLDDFGADPINAVIEPNKLTGFSSSSRDMSEPVREKSISATLKVTSKIPPGTIIKVPSAEDFFFYQVIAEPKKNKYPETHPNSIWVEKIPKNKVDENIRQSTSLATLDNLPLIPHVKEKLNL